MAEAPGPRQGEVEGDQPALQLVAIGESPLAGVGLAAQAEALTPQLAQRLAGQYQRAVAWRTAAAGGVTACACRQRLLPNLAAAPADLALIGLGVNDSLRLSSATAWQRDLRALIDVLRRVLGDVPVVLSAVPDMGRFPALPGSLRLLLGSRSRLLDAAAAELAEELDRVWHLPLPGELIEGQLFCCDGFHPNAEGHALWADQLAGFIRQRAII